MKTINDIAKLLNCKVVGNGEIKVEGLEPVDLAGEGDITFAVDEDNLEKAKNSRASCVITSVEVKDFPKPVLLVENMKIAITMLYNVMEQMKPTPKMEIHPSASISKTSKIGKNISIGPNVVICGKAVIGNNTIIEANCVIGANTEIGERVHLYPNVTIYGNVIVKNEVIIHSGTVIGADGFGYIPKDGKLYKVPQLGRVVIEDNVEIGANTCIDRGTFSDTVIGKGSKVDNLVQIAHNVKIGKSVVIAALSGIAGSSSIGDGTMLGGNVGIADHTKVGNNVKLAAKSGISGTINDNEVRFGYPDRNPEDHKKIHGLNSLLIRHYKQMKKFLHNLPPEE